MRRANRFPVGSARAEHTNGDNISRIPNSTRIMLFALAEGQNCYSRTPPYRRSKRKLRLFMKPECENFAGRILKNNTFENVTTRVRSATARLEVPRWF